MGATSSSCLHATLIILTTLGLSLQNTPQSSLSPLSLQTPILPTGRGTIYILSSLLRSHYLSAAHNL